MDPQEQLDVFQTDRGGFWHKLSAWLRPWKRRGDEELTEQMIRSGDEASRTGQDGARPGSDLTWPRRRTSQIGRLEEGFGRLVNLVDILDQHLQKQSDRSEQALTQTRRMADALSQGQALQKQRTEALEEMSNQYRNQTRQMQQVTEAVEALPRAMKQQSEQLGQVRDQLEAQLEAQLSTAQGIQQLAGATEMIRIVADDQRRHFEAMNEATQATNLEIARALERQNRRFTWLMAFTFTVALMAAASAALVIWWLARNMPGR
jgi:uncharacterized phage infection (PIP) family protein YhgE